MILSNLPATHGTFTEIAKRSEDYPSLEIFEFNKLYRNITHHHAQPKFRVLGWKEKQEIIYRYGGDANKLLIMESTDPIAKYYGLSYCENSVIECIRNTGLGPRNTVWRTVKMSSEIRKN